MKQASPRIFRHCFRIFAIATCIAVICEWAGTRTGQAAPAAPGSFQGPEEPSAPAEVPIEATSGTAPAYAGNETCAVCHEEHAAEFERTNPHATVPTSWGVTGCEACHGPGAAHVENPSDLSMIRRFGDQKTGESSATCLSCHERGHAAQWQGSAHDSRDIGCTTCHDVHTPERSESLLAASIEFDLCTSCHLQNKASLYRSSHMPMREGIMTCSSCHNPHGGQGPSNLWQVSINDNCYTCHAEKRAPMLWEHAPVKENCLNCHDPHGSLHGKLLVAKRPQLCQGCHDESRHPTTPYGSTQTDDFFPGTRIYNRACVNCHVQVHGSNHPAGLRWNR
jgi:DmsE family decaheme c-type cytochrome